VASEKREEIQMLAEKHGDEAVDRQKSQRSIKVREKNGENYNYEVKSRRKNYRTADSSQGRRLTSE